MKRTVAFMAGVLTLGVVVYAANRLLAAPTAPARPAGAGTRVAIINLRFVIKNYKKYRAFMETIKKKDQDYIGQVKAKNAEGNKYKSELNNPAVTAARREQLETVLRKLQRDIDDITQQARRDLARQGTEEMVRVYKEIREAASRHAAANNIDLVLHFEGPADNKEMDSPSLIQHNYNICCPLYWTGSLDISGHVLATLNAKFDNAAKATGGVTPKTTPRR